MQAVENHGFAVARQLIDGPHRGTTDPLKGHVVMLG